MVFKTHAPCDNVSTPGNLLRLPVRQPIFDNQILSSWATPSAMYGQDLSSICPARPADRPGSSRHKTACYRLGRWSFTLAATQPIPLEFGCHRPPGGASRWQLQQSPSDSKDATGLPGGVFTLSATKSRFKQGMPPACPVEPHARRYATPRGSFC
jgi:hypothetical protein